MHFPSWDAKKDPCLRARVGSFGLRLERMTLSERERLIESEWKPQE